MAMKRGNNEGSIHQRSKWKWRAQISLDGKRLSFTGKTRVDCQAWIRKMLEQVEQGLTYQGSQTLLGEFLTSWLEIVQTSLRPKTHKQYSQLVTNHIQPALGKIKLKDLTSIQIDGFYQKCIKSGVGNRTIRYIHGVLHCALQKAMKLGHIGRNSADGATPPRLITHEMLVMDEDQVSRFLMAADGSRNKALYHLAVKTGMRQGELLGLKWMDLNWTTGLLQVRRQVQRVDGKGFVFCEPKTRCGRRTVQVGEVTLQILREQKVNQQQERAFAGSRWQETDLIFPSTIGTPLDLRNLLREFKEILKQANLPEIRFHDLRHTAASIMLSHNIPVLTVSRMLGHAKPSITLDVYGHLIPGAQEEAARIMDAVLTPIIVKMAKVAKEVELVEAR